MSSDDPLLHAALDTARKSIGVAVSDAIDPAAAALKALLRTVSPAERPAVSQAQSILQFSRQPLLAAFEKALDQLVDEELLVENEASGFHDPTDWMSIGLVDEDQFENRLAFERVGQLIGHECEAELRELAAYTGELRQAGWADPERNPVRGQVIASALYKAVESVADGDQCRRLIVKELGQAMAKTLQSSYRAIVKDFSSRGFRQVELTVRPSAATAGGSGRGSASGAAGGAAGTGEGWPAGPRPAVDAASPFHAGLEAMRDLWEKSMMGRPLVPGATAGRGWESSTRNGDAAFGGGAPAGNDNSAAMLERLMQEATSGALWSAANSPGGATAPRGGGSLSDGELMNLLRRIGGALPARASSASAVDIPIDSGSAPTVPGTLTSLGGMPSLFGGLPPTNLIRAHHDELVQAASGEVDHMVIEVVASLFDQILADARVPPEIAREIARLQMPVLRVALRDATFFSARKHPVRRFINRISTLGASFGGFDNGPGKELLARASALVTEIVEGDFDQVPLYVRKVAELEQFVLDNARARFEGTPAAATLQAKETEWQMAKVFGAQFTGAYEPLPIPEYLKTFLGQVWSRVIVAAAQGDDPDRAREKRFRRAAFHLVASIQPKRSPEERQQFLAGLRGLTGTVDEGLALIGWPKDEQDAFFGKLMADHSASLKAAPGSDLDHNLLLRQLDAAARTPLPEAAAVGSPATGEGFEPRFTPREAARVGFVDEAAVDWSTPTPPVAGTAAAAAAAAAVAAAAAATATAAAAPAPSPVATPPALSTPVAMRAAVEAPALSASGPALRAPAGEPAPLVDAVAVVAPSIPTDPHALPTIVPPPLTPEPAAAPVADATPLPIPAKTAPAADPDEPTEGPRLVQHLQIGTSYRLHLKEKWEKVRLAHMNSSRSFFLFTHGAEDRGTISMTARMIERLCSTGRMKAYEDKPLLDRATERLRTQAPAPAPAPAVRRPELSAA